MAVKLKWVTPDGDNILGYEARVSNPEAQPTDDASRLIAYLIRKRHWSPLEMVSANVEIETTRDISRQILRHRSFSFQEKSGRYARYDGVGETLREARLQDTANRQNSLVCEDVEIVNEWNKIQRDILNLSVAGYERALELGIAKEQARAILPEGLTPTKMFMAGSLRSWVHYWSVRCTPETQKEHRMIAMETRDVILPEFPGLARALAAHGA